MQTGGKLNKVNQRQIQPFAFMEQKNGGTSRDNNCVCRMIHLNEILQSFCEHYEYILMLAKFVENWNSVANRLNIPIINNFVGQG